MHVSKPHLDKKRRKSPKSWYLSYFTLSQDAQGVIIRDENGRPERQRHRPYFPTRASAEAERTRLLEQQGSTGASGYGVLTATQVSEYQRAKAIVPEVALDVIAADWRRRNPTQARATITELREQFLENVKIRLGAKHQWRDLKTRTGIFAKSFGPRDPEGVDRKELLAWLNSMPGHAKAGRTVLNLKQSICTFYNWLRDEGLTSHNPAGGIRRQKLPKVKQSEIRFFPRETVERYLRACERYDPDLVASEAVQFFSGVRSDDEMRNFDGRWVLPATKEIVVPAEIAKKDRREVITDVEPVFWLWWAKYGRTGLLQPANYRKRWGRVRILAEIEDRQQADEFAGLPVKDLYESDLGKEKRGMWLFNVRRRTFATHHVAKYQSAGRTALIMRHRGDVLTLHNSYRGMGVTQEQGVAFFELRPRPVKDPIKPKTRPARTKTDDVALMPSQQHS